MEWIILGMIELTLEVDDVWKSLLLLLAFPVDFDGVGILSRLMKDSNECCCWCSQSASGEAKNDE